MNGSNQSQDDGWVLLEILVSLAILSIVAVTVSRILFQAEGLADRGIDDSFWSRSPDPESEILSNQQPLPVISSETDDDGGRWVQYRWQPKNSDQEKILVRYFPPQSPANP